MLEDVVSSNYDEHNNILVYLGKSSIRDRSSYTKSLFEHSNCNTIAAEDHADLDDINQLDLANGIKESLIEYGFDLILLLNTTSERIAEVLGIELDVAKIIHAAAVNYRKSKTKDIANI